MAESIKLKSYLLIMASIFIMPAVFAAQPKWVSENATEYPNSSYLVGRGVGSTANEAQDRARGDLATIFEVRIEVVNQNSISVAQSGKHEQVDRSSSQQVSAKTDKVIQGITIAEIWRDPVTQDFHALAVLSRAQASARLREELKDIDDAVLQNLQSAKSAVDPLLQIGALSQALQTTIKREGYQASLKIVDPAGQGVKAPVTQSELLKQIDDTLKNIKIASQIIDDDGNREFSSVVRGGLAAAGFLTSKNDHADLLLQSKLIMTDLGYIDRWNWIRGTVEVSLVEKATGRVRGSKTWPFKASAKDVKTARKRALIVIEKTLKEELRATIVEFASS